ncbi:MAG: TIGR02147 family protein [Reichenbachiella sp.]
MNKISIYNYWSTTDYLNAWFAFEKERNPVFSYQYFANKAGFKSRAFIANVLAGRKKFSTASLLKIAKTLKLGKRETFYFETLIHYDSASDDSEKEYYRDQLLYLKPAKDAYILERSHTRFLEKWYISPIREIVTFLDFNEDYKFLGLQLIPKISAKEAKEAVQILLSLNLITQYTRKNKILYKQTESIIETTPYVPKSLAIRNHQRKVITLGLESIERIPKVDRNINCSTFSINKNGIDAMNNLINDFHDKMVKIASDYEHEASQVYQANIQFFPLSVSQ